MSRTGIWPLVTSIVGTLAEFTISNAIPQHVVLAPDSISPGGISNGSNPGDIVSWDIGNLDDNATGSVFYRVQRPGSTPTSTLTITARPTRPGSGICR